MTDNYKDLKKHYDRIVTAQEYSDIMEHSKWNKEIPYIKFPVDWEIKIMAPFMGAVVRFSARKNNHQISVYLDCYDNLGYVEEPYWEFHPYHTEDGYKDCYRCLMNDTDELIEFMEKEFDNITGKI